MELLCDQCNLAIQIRKEWIPLNTTFHVTCPRCSRKIIVTSKSNGDEANTSYTLPSSGSLSELSIPECDVSEEFANEPMNSLQSGKPVCLLCINEEERRLPLKSLIEGMGYLVDYSTSPHHAFQLLRFNQYYIIVLDITFGGREPSLVADYLSRLNMNTRRDIFVVLCGDRFKTGDHWQAFVESVDFVCHPHNLLQVDVMLKRALSEHERFYRVFNECLRTAGKKI